MPTLGVRRRGLVGSSWWAGRVFGDLQVGATDADTGDNGARGVVTGAWLGGLALAMGDVFGWDDSAMTCGAMGLSEVCRNLLLDGTVLCINSIDNDSSAASDLDFLLVAFAQVL